MSIDRPDEYLLGILNELRQLPTETEWVEFKHNNSDPYEIGEYLSALSNSAVLLGKGTSWIVWGIDNCTHEILGTNFKPYQTKIHNQELEGWLLQLLNPKIHFRFYSLLVDEKSVILLEIGAAIAQPVQFKNEEFIRIGSYKKKLKDFPEKERELWRFFDRTPFEQEIAAENVTADQVLQLLNHQAYFILLNKALPASIEGCISPLAADELISPGIGGLWNICNLGAILFARNLCEFRSLKRKSVRVVMYKDESRVTTIHEQEGIKGYAAGFEGLIDFITNLLPSNEVIGRALRKEVPVFPELAIRELVANAIIHQDFHATGTAPMVEIFSRRMEITNPGLPLVSPDRFLDSPPKSRNEKLASFMRRIGICEERGSGIDKVVFLTEFYQLPAPIFETTNAHTRVVFFAHREFKEMDNTDRVRACYLHACLKYEQRDFMTNTTLRERFGIEEKNRAMVSRIIADTRAKNLIRCFDDSVGAKAKKYIPWWA